VSGNVSCFPRRQREHVISCQLSWIFARPENYPIDIFIRQFELKADPFRIRVQVIAVEGFPNIRQMGQGCFFNFIARRPYEVIDTLCCVLQRPVNFWSEFRYGIQRNFVRVSHPVVSGTLVDKNPGLLFLSFGQSNYS